MKSELDFSNRLVREQVAKAVSEEDFDHIFEEHAD